MAESAARFLDVGPAGTIQYRVIRSKRRRRTIQLGIEGGEVLVRAPMRTSEREIADLVRERAGWIARQRAQLPSFTLEDGAVVPLLGAPLTLRVTSDHDSAPGVQRGLLELRVTLPAHVDATQHADATREALTGWLRAYASEIVPRYVERRVEALGRAPRRVLVRDQRRRWGSCAPDGSLRFNWRLVMLDEALIDYVAVHELAHLHQANHGPAFWRIVEDVLPDHRALRHRLREAGRRLPL